MSLQQQQPNLLMTQINDQNDLNGHFQLSPLSPLTTVLENLNLSSATYSENQIMMKTQTKQQFNYDENSNKYVINALDQDMDALQQRIKNDLGQLGPKKRDGANNDGVNRYHDSLYIAEVKRREKMNRRFYALQALLPKMSKLDRVSILENAIDYVIELKGQVQDLQNQLIEEHSSNDEGNSNNCSIVIQKDVRHGKEPKSAHVAFSNRPFFEASTNGGIDVSKKNQDVEIKCDKVQQMEPQVEVGQLEGNKFYVEVLCEHKPSGFMRLMNAFNTLGLEVANVIVTSFKCLISVYKVKKRHSEMVQVHHVKESLLKQTRYP